MQKKAASSSLSHATYSPSETIRFPPSTRSPVIFDVISRHNFVNVYKGDWCKECSSRGGVLIVLILLLNDWEIWIHMFLEILHWITLELLPTWLTVWLTYRLLGIANRRQSQNVVASKGLVSNIDRSQTILKSFAVIWEVQKDSIMKRYQIHGIMLFTQRIGLEMRDMGVELELLSWKWSVY